MVTYSVSNQTPSESFFLQKRGQTGPGHKQETKCLEQESCVKRMQTPDQCLGLPVPHVGDKAAPLDKGKYILLGQLSPT